MAKTITPLSLLFLILLLLFSTISHSSTNFQFFDVSSSLKLTKQVFSTSPKQSQTQEFSSQDSLPFTLTLHPRSTLFPHTNNNYTSLSLARLARDSVRVNSLLSSPLTSGYSQGIGEYFASIGIGQPVKQSYLVIDTGSDVTWLQCNPCMKCYQQLNPIFNPASSSTYQTLPCSSQQCNALDISACSQSRTCLYKVSYGDGSSTSGVFSTETLSFCNSGTVPNVAIGCGYDNEGLFVGSDGLLGLGGGELSFPSQIKADSFSYCLVNRDSRAVSTLEFNSMQPVDSISAPLLENSMSNTYYYVGLVGFTVGGVPVDIPDSLFVIGGDGRGGVIVDSGTAVTRLRSEAYNALRDAFVGMSKDLRSTAGFDLFDTCYDFSGLKTANVPTVAFKFAGGKTLPLAPGNVLIPVDENGKHCFAFAPTEESLSEGLVSIIGNLQQQGMRVSYNLASRTVGFSPNKC